MLGALLEPGLGELCKNTAPAEVATAECPWTQTCPGRTICIFVGPAFTSYLASCCCNTIGCAVDKAGGRIPSICNSSVASDCVKMGIFPCK